MCTRILLIISAFQPPHSPRQWSWFSNSPTFPPPTGGGNMEHETYIYIFVYTYINLYTVSLESLLRSLNSPRTATAAGPPWQKLPGAWLGPERGPAWCNEIVRPLVSLFGSHEQNTLADWFICWHLYYLTFWGKKMTHRLETYEPASTLRLRWNIYIYIRVGVVLMAQMETVDYPQFLGIRSLSDRPAGFGDAREANPKVEMWT